MSALPAFLQGTLRADWHVGRHVGFLHAAGDGWHVRHLDAAATAPGTVTEAGGEVSGPFDAVLLALPAPQAAPLLRAIGHGYAEAVGRVVIAPCWALMLAFEEPQPGPDAQRPADGAFGWIARDSARPGRAAVPECWVAHARPDWSRAALERPAEAVLAELQVAFASVTGIAATPMHAAVHRWRHAMTETPLGEPCLWDAAARLGVCGDWCLGARVEAAWQSGAALAEGC
jgi:predicted NAD/FAD-dependent oxidoreductase